MQKVANYLPKMYKALMPLALGVVMEGLATLGLRADMTLEEAVGYLAASGLVWLKRQYP